MKPLNLGSRSKWGRGRKGQRKWEKNQEEVRGLVAEAGSTRRRPPLPTRSGQWSQRWRRGGKDDVGVWDHLPSPTAEGGATALPAAPTSQPSVPEVVLLWLR